MISYLGTEKCACGRAHTATIDEIVIGSGAIKKIPQILDRYQVRRPFLLADVNTDEAAGKAVCALLDQAGVGYEKFVFPDEALKPCEQSVGAAMMRWKADCDGVIAVGSGVLNDIGKIISNVAKVKYLIVATAPSMDGYASASSSMDVDGLKVSLASRCADVIVGDTDILKNAPMRMLKAGVGDMLAKYVSLAEWRIAHEITGEYYCPRVAELVRTALNKCVENSAGLLRREEKAVEAVFEGLVIGGIAMAYAGVSRPASGVEHYFSHVWDMRGLELGTPVELHGIQCALGTYVAAKLYDQVKRVTPDKNRAKSYVAAFDKEAWRKNLLSFLGKSGQTMIALEEKEGKYDKVKHAERLNIILQKWQDIIRILQEELPSGAEIGNILDQIELPKSPSVIGVDGDCLRQTFVATKDIRDKYVLSRLAWDLGIIDELCELL